MSIPPNITCLTKEIVEKSFPSQYLDSLKSDFQKISKLQNKSVFPFTDFDGASKMTRRFVVGDPLEKYLLVNSKSLSLVNRLQLAIDISESVEFLHKKLIPCVSLTPNNIIVTPEGIPILVDFGISAAIKKDKKNSDIIFYGPECLFQDFKLFSLFEHDIWSLGVILYLILTGDLPWPTNNLPRLMKMMGKTPFSLPDNIPSEINGLLTKMMNQRTDFRPTIEHVVRIVKHSFEKDDPSKVYVNNNNNNMNNRNNDNNDNFANNNNNNNNNFKNSDNDVSLSNNNVINISNNNIVNNNSNGNLINKNNCGGNNIDADDDKSLPHMNLNFRGIIPKMIIHKSSSNFKKVTDVTSWEMAALQSPAAARSSINMNSRNKRRVQCHSAGHLQPSFLADCEADE